MVDWLSWGMGFMAGFYTAMIFLFLAEKKKGEKND